MKNSAPLRGQRPRRDGQQWQKSPRPGRAGNLQDHCWPGTWARQSGETNDGLQYNASDLPKITHNVADVEIENQTTWNKNFVGVREITTEGDKYIFKLRQPYGAIAQQIGWNAGLTLNSDQIIHNALELLDQPGEFYFDARKKRSTTFPAPAKTCKPPRRSLPSRKP